MKKYPNKRSRWLSAKVEAGFFGLIVVFNRESGISKGSFEAMTPIKS